MSWAAHEFESFVIEKHLRTKVSYLAVLLGCLLPDFFTKLPVYGLHIGDMELIKAGDPAAYHRGWPGVGPTHSLMFGVVAALVTLAITRHRGWAVGILVGEWSHVLTDAFDSVGTMIFFPFTTQHYSVGMWKYAAQEGRYSDAAAYYSSLGLVWDLLWLGVALTGFEVLRGRFFDEHVEPADPAWGWLRRRFGFGRVTLLAIYRAWFVYGAARVVAWFLWARFLNPRRGVETIDLSWGGPSWVADAGPAVTPWGDFVLLTAVGVVGLAASLVVIWWTIGRRLWIRAEAPTGSIGLVAAASTG